MMSVSSPSPAAYQSARRFIGRRAAVCRKHGGYGQEHHINRMGGLVCSACHPARTDADCVLRLVIRGGLWDDAENPFDNFAEQEEGHGPRAATATTPENTNATAAQKTATNFDATTTSEPSTPRNSRKVGEPLLELELDFYFNLPSACDGKWLGPEVISSSQIGEESKSVRKRAGLLESSALDRGFVGGTVRRGEGFGLSADPLRNPTVSTQFAVGQVVRLLRRLDTFRGVVHPGGGYRVSSSGKDFWGCPLVVLSLGGMVVVSGLVPDAETIAVDAVANEVISIDELIG